jgi:hypothetical protein
MKKYIIFSLLLSFISLQIDANNYPTNDCESTTLNIGKKVELQAGTPVILELAEKVQSDAMTVGQLIRFKVSTNVVVDGKIAIRSGALALGRVKHVSPSTYNNAAQLTIEVNSVQAVDGQQIPLDGNEQTVKGQFSGQGTTALVGIAITSTVMNDITIKTK